MKRVLFIAAGATLALTACSESPTQYSEQQVALDAAYSAVLLGYGNTYNSFLGGDSTFVPGTMRGPGPGHGRGPGQRGPGMGALMAGGLNGPFLGLGGHDRLTLPASCVFDAGTARVVCPAETRGGLTVSRSVAFTDAAGNAQSAFDSTTTNAINTRATVSGTVARRDSSSTTVQATSERTVSGLLGDARTINGASAGTEHTSGIGFTAVRTMGDTVQNVVIPRRTDGTRPYPTAGTVIRSMNVTLTRDGQAPVSSARREVVTYDGTATATVVITQDGTTRTCTLPLPHGRPSC